MTHEERSGFEAFVDAHWSPMFRLAHALTGNRDDAEDVVQATFAKAYAAWTRVRAADRPEAYVRRMVVNEVHNGWRRRWRHVERSVPVVPDGAGSGHGHDDVVATSDMVWRCLQRLPAKQRAVIVLRFYEDLSEREVAAILEIPPGTVKSRTNAAMRALRAELAVHSHGLDSDVIEPPQQPEIGLGRSPA
ncbi:SigE family RNA polymerase sigma factor [Mumia zhuanghuii]|uniref:SigE family RNA polymerase sigma factor n=2 Tax=Mumia TaxID=1546255 RepID=A0ABW1QES3_9ACTN|nr:MULTISPECIES: SigE family RNA polymerase sigma factor [Mumia]KAA1422906.1 SigE family RNA polymerase sigma factor [Mumia zhuanghuii]